jgi:lipopolysaccharide cholinephosphotransferase
METEINPEILRKVQVVQLEILLEFDRICKENDLPYQLFSGTLLGAIRHKGFIPWDDDIDVIMKRNDYEKFLSICDKQLNPKYFLQNYNTDPKWYRQFSRIRKNNTKYLQASYKEMDMHHGIFIDIFPMDVVKVNSILERVRCKILYIFSKLNRIRNREIFPHLSLSRRIIHRLIKTSNIFIKKPVFDRLETRIMKLFNNKKTGYFNHYTNGVTRQRFDSYLMEEEDLDDIINGKFEGYSFPIPKNYHRLLTQLSHHYCGDEPRKMNIITQPTAIDL